MKFILRRIPIRKKINFSILIQQNDLTFIQRPSKV